MIGQAVLEPGLIVSSVLVMWKTLILLTGSESPVVVVLSGSMEPAMYRGDILFLNMGKAPIRTGEIVVFYLDGRDIPIVHRVIAVHERANGTHVDVLTKGDNNHGDDRTLYNKGQEWLHQQHIMGRAVGFLPKLGMVTIVLNDYPYLKYALISVLGLLLLTNKET
ncbi:Signal peptidase complex catalytic subunit SEC11C [Tetrabaena socialis]|uniref:Signal peptidase complex catalytic subunit SEC11 n=1 Tax=Tetrabaena socialis TaxID=47790 RepID=A0A2J7ZQ91_9CHLO|nr:Signal peptidase complex catalytic subunit SEC11C [Tetrabaena socialis]|eukprot:PNH02439.1 Signal peptidase complex catalytic subunit SEC11C [Tetrabaena socialis]